MSAAALPDGRLLSVELDETVGRVPPDIEHERAVAVADLVEDGRFEPAGLAAAGPFRLRLAIDSNRLVFDIRNEAGEPIATHVLSLTPLRRTLRDYFMICDSYYEAMRSATPSQIEAIDMGRRGIHNDGSQLLRERLDGKIALDLDTARRLFTLISVLSRRS